MPSNREAYFEALKLNIPKSIIDFALCEVNSFSYSELTKFFDEEISDYPFFKDAITRYLNGEMIEYIFHKAYFLQEPFYVDKNVLIPRQETEQLVIRVSEIIKEQFKEQKITVADVCAGSGCIGISLAKNLPFADFFLTDISKDALKIADKNWNDLRGNITKHECLLGDMLSPLKNKKIDVIVCNPPYIEKPETIDKKTWEQEPHLALLAKPSTLFYEKLLRELDDVVNSCFLVAFEIGEDMENELTKLIDKYCPKDDFWFEKDIYGKTRFLFIKNSGV